MKSKRIKRINSLIKEELSKILLKEFEFPKEVLVTVTRVEITRNLREGKIFVSCFPEKERKKIVDFLNRKIYFIQKNLDKKLVMRPVPKIKFFEEERTVEAGKIEAILEKLKKEKK